MLTSTGLQAPQDLETGVQGQMVSLKAKATILVYPALQCWSILLIAYFHKVRARGVQQGSPATDSMTGRKLPSPSEGPSSLFTELGCHSFVVWGDRSQGLPHARQVSVLP